MQKGKHMFKKRRGINLNYNKQGLIHFTCVNFNEQPQDVQSKIIKLCTEVAGKDFKALFEILTNDNKNIHAIATDNYISETTLYKLRREFYERW